MFFSFSVFSQLPFLPCFCKYNSSYFSFYYHIVFSSCGGKDWRCEVNELGERGRERERERESKNETFQVGEKLTAGWPSPATCDRDRGLFSLSPSSSSSPSSSLVPPPSLPPSLSLPPSPSPSLPLYLSSRFS